MKVSLIFNAQRLCFKMLMHSYSTSTLKREILTLSIFTMVYVTFLLPSSDWLLVFYRIKVMFFVLTHLNNQERCQNVKNPSIQYNVMLLFHTPVSTRNKVMNI